MRIAEARRPDLMAHRIDRATYRIMALVDSTVGYDQRVRKEFRLGVQTRGGHETKVKVSHGRVRHHWPRGVVLTFQVCERCQKPCASTRRNLWQELYIIISDGRSWPRRQVTRLIR